MSRLFALIPLVAFFACTSATNDERANADASLDAPVDATDGAIPPDAGCQSGGACSKERASCERGCVACAHDGYYQASCTCQSGAWSCPIVDCFANPPFTDPSCKSTPDAGGGDANDGG